MKKKSVICNTFDQPFHQLLKNLQLLPQKCTVALQWIKAHCGVLGNERADCLAKSGSKGVKRLSTSTYQNAKTMLWTVKDPSGEKPLENATPLQTSSIICWNMSRPLYWCCKMATVPYEHTWSKMAYGLCILRLQRSTADSPPYLPGPFPLVATETVMAAGWDNHQQAVGNGRKPVPHHPVPGSMWTTGLSRAEWLQKNWKLIKSESKQLSGQH